MSQNTFWRFSNIFFVLRNPQVRKSCRRSSSRLNRHAHHGPPPIPSVRLGKISSDCNIRDNPK